MSQSTTGSGSEHQTSGVTAHREPDLVASTSHFRARLALPAIVVGLVGAPLLLGQGDPFTGLAFFVAFVIAGGVRTLWWRARTANACWDAATRSLSIPVLGLTIPESDMDLSMRASFAEWTRFPNGATCEVICSDRTLFIEVFF